MDTGAGEDETLRRWRLTVTVFSILLLVRSGFSLVFGLVLMPLAGMLPSEGVAAQLRALALAKVGLAGAVTAGSVGLLMRRKWGWYTVVIIQVLEVAAAFFLGVSAMRPVLALADPARAGAASIVIAALIALVPASIAGFLMLGPVVAQFEKNVPD